MVGSGGAECGTALGDSGAAPPCATCGPVLGGGAALAAVSTGLGVCPWGSFGFIFPFFFHFLGVFLFPRKETFRGR